MKGKHSEAYKIIILGDSSVGKTSIINQYINNEFNDKIISTIGVDCQQKIIKINEEQIKIAIYDTSGQEKYRSLLPQYYRNADGIILVYDITNVESLKSIEDYWVPQILENIGKSSYFHTILVGNKSDLINDHTENFVSLEAGQNVARNLSCLFVEVSAKTGHHLQAAFDEFFQRINFSSKMFEVPHNIDLNSKIDENIDESFCC